MGDSVPVLCVLITVLCIASLFVVIPCYNAYKQWRMIHRFKKSPSGTVFYLKYPPRTPFDTTFCLKCEIVEVKSGWMRYKIFWSKSPQIIDTEDEELSWFVWKNKNRIEFEEERCV